MNPTDRREQRLQSYKKARSEKEIYERVLAPTLYEFVVWVLQEALQSGTKRLYFLARDGYQMYLAARQLCKQYDLDIECRYLKVSRYAVRVPEYHLLGERCLERICVGGIDVTFEKIMQRAALTDKEAEEIAALAGYTENYRKVINYHEVMQLKDRLKKIPLLFHYIDSHSKEAYGTAIGYLTQEGLLEPVPYALVDSGWIGTIQQSIEHLLRQKQPDRKLEGYYFGLYEIPEGERKENYHSFYFTPWGEIKRKVHFSNSLFEAVFSAPEGMTLSYRTEGEKDKISYVPVTDSVTV
jgi:predicted HAD superfamily hydrolase